MQTQWGEKLIVGPQDDKRDLVTKRVLPPDWEG